MLAAGLLPGLTNSPAQGNGGSGGSASFRDPLSGIRPTHGVAQAKQALLSDYLRAMARPLGDFPDPILNLLDIESLREPWAARAEHPKVFRFPAGRCSKPYAIGFGIEGPGRRGDASTRCLPTLRMVDRDRRNNNPEKDSAVKFVAQPLQKLAH
jgi:hypothetical protein